jgi:hypothetical protein
VMIYSFYMQAVIEAFGKGGVQGLTSHLKLQEGSQVQSYRDEHGNTLLHHAITS